MNMHIVNLPLWEEYIHTQQGRNPGLSLVSALHLCHIICYTRKWGKFDIPRWHRICEDLLFLIDKASASSLPDCAQIHEDEHPDRTKASEVAHAILQDIDNHEHGTVEVARWSGVSGGR